MVIHDIEFVFPTYEYLDFSLFHHILDLLEEVVPVNLVQVFDKTNHEYYVVVVHVLESVLDVFYLGILELSFAENLTQENNARDLLEHGLPPQNLVLLFIHGQHLKKGYRGI